MCIRKRYTSSAGIQEKEEAILMIFSALIYRLESGKRLMLIINRINEQIIHSLSIKAFFTCMEEGMSSEYFQIFTDLTFLQEIGSNYRLTFKSQS